MELPVSTPVSNGRKLSYRLETRNLTYVLHGQRDQFSWISCWKKARASPRRILKDVNCEARPGEITAIAGPSGAGKTTLLEILAANISSKRVSGHVLMNGNLINGETFRRVSGYVSQDDSLFPLLTIKETLMYSALLRLPGGKKEAANRVRVLLKELGLVDIAESRIGQGSNHGISGGERRRVSIAVELVHDPAVILIDEPTSGLDSASALHIVSLLKLMVLNQGKTIILTIHQPGFRVLQLFDQLILLSNGCVVHNGSLQLLEERLNNAGYCIPRHVNVLEFAIDVSRSISLHASENINSQFFLNNQTEAKVRQDEDGIDISRRISHSNNAEDKCLSYLNSTVEEILILGERFCKITLRTNQLFLTRIIQALAVGLILGTIYMNICNDLGQVALQARLGFFAFTLTFLLSSTTEGLPIFLQERRIFMRETSRGAYRVYSYVIANTVIFLPFLLMVGLLYATPVYWLVGLRRSINGFLYFALVVWMVVLMANSFTACFSALVPDFIMGTSVIAGLMGSFFLFSGYFISKEKIPPYWKFMHYLSLFRYPFECFLINEYGGDGGSRCLEDERGVCILYGNGFLRQQGLMESQKWSNLAVMLGFIISYRVFSFLILWYRHHRNRN